MFKFEKFVGTFNKDRNIDCYRQETFKKWQNLISDARVFILDKGGFDVKTTNNNNIYIEFKKDNDCEVAQPFDLCWFESKDTYLFKADPDLKYGQTDEGIAFRPTAETTPNLVLDVIEGILLKNQGEDEINACLFIRRLEDDSIATFDLFEYLQFSFEHLFIPEFGANGKISKNDAIAILSLYKHHFVGSVANILSYLDNASIYSGSCESIIIKTFKDGVKHFDKVKNIIYVNEKKEKTITTLSGQKIEYSHSFECRGHWRRINPLKYGKNRQGDYCVPGKTWVKSCVKGQGVFIKKTRVIMPKLMEITQ